MEISRIIILLLSATFIMGCTKDDEELPTTGPSPIASMCIGQWRADSSFVPNTGLYNHHDPATFNFTNSGDLQIGWPDGSSDQYTFWVGEESDDVSAQEIGRALIWFKEGSDGPDENDGILMIFQSPTECFLLLSDDIGSTSPWNTLAIVNENLVTMGDPVFDFWAKCYKQ